MARRLEAIQGIVSIHSGSESKKVAEREREKRIALRREGRALRVKAGSGLSIHMQLPPVDFTIGNNGGLIFKE